MNQALQSVSGEGKLLVLFLITQFMKFSGKNESDRLCIPQV